MDKRKITIACCQMQSALGAKEQNISKMISMLEEAVTGGDTDLVIFPELAVTGYECGELYQSLAEPFPDGDTAQILSEQAKKHGVHLIYGFVEQGMKDGRPVLYNSAALIDDQGRPLGCYRKSHLVDGEETRFFEKGTEYNVYETSIGRIGLMICWDMAYPEVARILALKGAEIIAAPAAWETEPNEGDWEIVNTARSFDNVVYLASCNHVGTDRELSFFGRSRISGPLGRPIAAAADQEQIIRAAVDLDQLQPLREGYYVLLKDRNPSTYEEIVK
ncbi:MAG: carbon-nitrogen hydrolase family protein [Firmicutes bacterium]|nr:carbon-nitrogen hydrolase family protein [Bacillota bacterium]